MKQSETERDRSKEWGRQKETGAKSEERERDRSKNRVGQKKTGAKREWDRKRQQQRVRERERDRKIQEQRVRERERDRSKKRVRQKETGAKSEGERKRRRRRLDYSILCLSHFLPERHLLFSDKFSSLKAPPPFHCHIFFQHHNSVCVFPAFVFYVEYFVGFFLDLDFDLWRQIRKMLS